MLQRADQPLHRAQIDPRQGAVGGRGQGGELLERRHPLRSRRVREPKERLRPAHRPDTDVGDLFRRGRQVLHRAELSTGDRKDVHRPEQGRRQQAVCAAEARFGRAEVSLRRAGKDGVRGQTRLADWTAASPWRMWSAATTDVDDDGGRPDHHEGDHDGRDLPTSAEDVGARSRPGARSSRGPRRAVPRARRSSPLAAYCGTPVYRGTRRRSRVNISRLCHYLRSGCVPSLGDGHSGGIVWPL